MSKVVSIQVAATCHTPDDILVTSVNAPDVTHFSVYLRGEDGCAAHQQDFFIHSPHLRDSALAAALLLGAMLSHEHRAPIEAIL